MAALPERQQAPGDVDGGAEREAEEAKEAKGEDRGVCGREAFDVGGRLDNPDGGDGALLRDAGDSLDEKLGERDVHEKSVDDRGTDAAVGKERGADADEGLGSRVPWRRRRGL